MPPTLKLRATVLAGHRVEFTAPELPEGAEVEISVVLPAVRGPMPASAPPAGGVADYLASLPPISRSVEEWAAVERQFREERDSWDR
jgi:hypothetical protein